MVIYKIVTPASLVDPQFFARLTPDGDSLLAAAAERLLATTP